MLTSLNRTAFEDLLQRYDAAITRLESWSVRVSSQSRLRKYSVDLGFLAAGGLPGNARDVSYLGFSVLEADELVDIVDAIEDDEIDAETMDRLRDLPKDPAVRAQGTKAPGRSSQFELYVRALLKRGGLTIQMSTPDLAVYVEADPLTKLELKRPLSSSSLDANLRKALSQIKNADGSGGIVLGLDHLLLGNRGVVELERGETVDDGHECLVAATSEWIESHRRVVDRRIKRSGVDPTGIILLVKVPIVSRGSTDMGFGFHLRTLHMSLPESRERAALDRVDAALERVWGVPS